MICVQLEVVLFIRQYTFSVFLVSRRAISDVSLTRFKFTSLFLVKLLSGRA